MAQQVSLLGGLGGLGIIPSWYFDTNPATNKVTINPHVKFPEGMNQLTVQPVGYYMGSGESNLQGHGLGFFNSAWWQQRKWIALGVLGALGVGAAAIATKVLR